MNVVKITPRGYCHGVVQALNIVSQVANDPNVMQPIYILGEIVHNNNVTQALNNYGIITLSGGTREELLNRVTSGTVIITAHGIDPKLIELAKSRRLNVVDATCKDVYKTHDIIRQKLSDNYTVIYIGKKNHPETEGCIAIDKKIILVTSLDDIEQLKINSDKICVTNQTTLSLWDMSKMLDLLKLKFNGIEIINEICDATQLRQYAVANMEQNIDLLFVVGDCKSNNTNKLVEISKTIAKIPAIRIDNSRDIKIEDLKNITNVAVTSGASTPTLITKNVIDYLEQFDYQDISSHNNYGQFDINRIIPRKK